MWKLFKDENDINEKAIVGFASFVLMVIFAVCDLITGWCGYLQSSGRSSADIPWELWYKLI